MTNHFDCVINQVVDQMEDTTAKNLLAGAFQASIDKQKADIEILLAAKNEGELNSDEFDRELEREKLVTQAEMLTWQIASKAEVQKIVNKAFHLLQEAVL